MSHGPPRARSRGCRRRRCSRRTLETQAATLALSGFVTERQSWCDFRRPCLCYAHDVPRLLRPEPRRRAIGLQSATRVQLPLACVVLSPAYAVPFFKYFFVSGMACQHPLTTNVLRGVGRPCQKRKKYLQKGTAHEDLPSAHDCFARASRHDHSVAHVRSGARAD